MSLWKHFGEQGNDQHGGQLFWSEALQGIPFRGNYAPLLTRDELERDVHIQSDFRFKHFKLWENEDAEYYQWVMDRAVNGWFVVYKREWHWVEQHQSHVVYVEWSQRYGELSPVAKASARSRAHGPPSPTPVDPPPRIPHARGTSGSNGTVKSPLSGLQPPGF